MDTLEAPSETTNYERVNLGMFSRAMGIVGNSLRGYLIATRSPQVRAHIERLKDNPHKGLFLIPIKRNTGRAYALQRSLEELGQTGLLERIQEDAKYCMQGGRMSSGIDDEYGQLSRFPDQGELERAIVRIGAGFTSSLTVTGDPELVEAAKDPNSKEALEHAEYRGRAEGYLQVLQELQQGNQILKSHQEAEPIVNRLIKAHMGKSSSSS